MARRGTGDLLRQGHAEFRANRDVAWPMILLAAVLHMLLQSLLRPMGPLDPARPDNTALLALLAATGLLASLALLLAVVWSRTVFLGRSKAMEGGLLALLRRWGAALGLLAWAMLLWLIALLPAMLLAGTLGLILSQITGGLPVAVQLIIALACLALPSLTIGAVLWAAVGQMALDRPVTLLDAMISLAGHWRAVTGLMLVAALPPLLLASLVLLLAADGGLIGMMARAALSGCALASVLLVLPSLVRLSEADSADS